MDSPTPPNASAPASAPAGAHAPQAICGVCREPGAAYCGPDGFESAARYHKRCAILALPNVADPATGDDVQTANARAAFRFGI